MSYRISPTVAKRRGPPPGDRSWRWCAACGFTTIPAPDGLCSECGYPYDDARGDAEGGKEGALAPAATGAGEGS